MSAHGDAGPQYSIVVGDIILVQPERAQNNHRVVILYSNRTTLQVHISMFLVFPGCRISRALHIYIVRIVYKLGILGIGMLHTHQNFFAANNYKFTCSNQRDGVWMDGEGMNWGYWTEWEDCPTGSYICGIKTQVESSQGGNSDDTALNDAIFYCCDLS